MNWRTAFAVAAVALFLPTVGWAPSAAGHAEGAQALTGAPWVEMESPSPEEPSLPSTPDGRHFRVRLDVSVPPGTGHLNLPVSYSLDIAQVLRSYAGYPSHPESGELLGFELDLGSFTLIEVDENDEPLEVPLGGKGRIPVEVFRGSFTETVSFDAATAPVVTLSWVMPGETTGIRHFHLYFDAIHNGDRTPHQPSSTDLGRIAAAVGPGRASNVYVSLTEVVGGALDSRELLLTNLQESSTTVEIYEYDPFTALPMEEPVEILELPGGVGSPATFEYREDYKSSGNLFLDADSPILVEALHGGNLAGFEAGSSTLFLPARDGGFIGTSFVDTPRVASTWFLYCPGASLEQGETHCSGVFSRDGTGGEFSLSPGTHQTLDISPGQHVALDANVGKVAVQRVTEGQGRRPPVLWPAMDGPYVSSSFMGHASTLEPTETLLIASSDPAATLRVKDMAGSKTTLSQAWEIGEGLFTEGNRIGAVWSRSWDGAATHDTGPVLLHPASAGDPATQGLSLINGEIDHNDLGAFSALVSLQSSDGGLRYTAYIPADENDNPLGKLVVFAPHPSTEVRLSVSGPSPASKVFNLRQHQVIDNWRDMDPAPGTWNIQADRPVVASWVKPGQDPMAAYAPGITDVAQVQATGAQAIGYSIGVDTDPPLHTTTASDEVTFTVTVSNHAHDAEGVPLGDKVELTVDAPSGWDEDKIFVVPSTLDLAPPGEPGSTGTATVQVQVPSGSAGGSGAVLQLVAESLGSISRGGDLAVRSDMIINILDKHGVQVAAEGSTARATATVEQEGQQWANFRVSVRNTGGSPDSFNLEFPRSVPEWLVNIDEAPGSQEPKDRCRDLFKAELRTPSINPGEQVHYNVNISLAPGATDAFRFTGFFTAVSIDDCSAFDSVQLVTEVQGEHHLDVRVDDPERVIAPGSSTTFLVDLQNLAESKEEFNVTLAEPTQPTWPQPTVGVHLSGPGQPATPLDPKSPLVSLRPQETLRLAITQQVPADSPPLAMAVDRLFLRSTSPSGPHEEIPLRVIAARVVGFDVSLDPPQLAVKPGVPVNADLVVRSQGNVPQIIEITTSTMEGGAWNITSSSGSSLNETQTLDPATTLRLPIIIDVPPDAAPSVVAAEQMAIRIAAVGVPAQTLPIIASVEEHAAFEVLDDTVAVTPGRTTLVTIPVQNTGNVPIKLGAEPVTNEQIGSILFQERALAVGEKNELFAEFTVPSDASAGLASINVHWTDASQRMHTSVLVVQVGAPSISSRVIETETIDPGVLVYRVELSNKGDAPAYDVVAVLRDGDLTIDEGTIATILPGGTHQINLAARASMTDPAIHVVAAHDPTGTTLDGTALEGKSPTKGAPSTLGVLAILGVAYLFRMRRGIPPLTTPQQPFGGSAQ